jgi:signal transduction histidine kinase
MCSPGVIARLDSVPAHRRLLLVDAARVAPLLAPLDRPVVAVDTIHDALVHLEDHDFAFALIGASLDGVEVARRIRAHDDLPIIILTPDPLDRDRALRGYRLGAVDYVVDPIEPEILLAKARIFLALQDGADADREKDGFLAILGHELRNPLAPIRTAIDFIRAHPDRPVSARMTAILDRQTTVMTRLVDDLLDLSRIGANKIELRPERLDLRALVDAAVTTSRSFLGQRRHALSITTGTEPLRVVVDQVRLLQVLVNLLNNAARYTAPGGRIEIACRREGGRALVRISDSGIGIPPELLPRIFDMFVQERVRSNGSGGLGLGLALARRIVELHHGAIRATSAGRGTGSQFEVDLPLEGSDSVLVARTRSDAMEPLLRDLPPALRAVVIDDNADARELVAELLTSHGHAVVTAEDGPAGLAMIREHRPDVALVDLGLPGLDGVSLVTELRAAHPELRTRFVALTGYGSAADLRRTRAAGFHAHLVKPATEREILAALRG